MYQKAIDFYFFFSSYLSFLFMSFFFFSHVSEILCERVRLWKSYRLSLFFPWLWAGRDSILSFGKWETKTDPCFQLQLELFNDHKRTSIKMWWTSNPFPATGVYKWSKSHSILRNTRTQILFDGSKFHCYFIIRLFIRITI